MGGCSASVTDRSLTVEHGHRQESRPGRRDMRRWRGLIRRDKRQRESARATARARESDSESERTAASAREQEREGRVCECVRST